MKEKMKQWYRDCRGYLFTLAGGLLFLGLFLILRQNRDVMNFAVQYITTPLKRGLSWLVCLLPFSAMELCIALLAGLAVFLIIRCICRLRREGFRILSRTLLFFCCAALLIYDGFCLFWGINYYGDTFSDMSGIKSRPVSVDELYAVTMHYAEIANENAPLVSRDEEGVFNEDMDDIFAGAEHVYDHTAERWPFMQSPWRKPKPVFFSRVMSEIHFTGVYFPFLGESNINVDCPSCLIPSTIAHELAHQKNIAPEQEANFLAVVSSCSSDNACYRYSGALLACIHLGNALYRADYSLWEKYNEFLSPFVKADLHSNNVYWDAFTSKAADAADTVYTGFLQSYGQKLGLKSYGACVDLLVVDYIRSLHI